MNQTEKRIYLIKELKKEDKRFSGYTPEALSTDDQKKIVTRYDERSYACSA